MKIKNFMSTNIIHLHPDDTLKQTADLFLQKRIDGAPVIDKGKIIGLLTKTHLIRAISNGTDMNKPIRFFMSRKLKL